MAITKISSLIGFSSIIQLIYWFPSSRYASFMFIPLIYNQKQSLVPVRLTLPKKKKIKRISKSRLPFYDIYDKKKVIKRLEKSSYVLFRE